jgi:nitrogen regulatory protein PII
MADTTPQAPAKDLPVIKFLVFIIDWSKVKVVSTVFEAEKVRFHYVTKAKGTASSDILDLLGIGTSEKAVLTCLEQDVLVPVLLREVRKKLGRHSAGAGIAFTIPLSGINNPVMRVFTQRILNNETIDKEAAMGTDKHDLIISIINQGYSDEFMAVAKEAGATGGTVISARGLAHEGPVKFFGVSLQEEKEIILIVTHRDKKTPIMQAISQHYGLSSKAEGVVFSLPVDHVMGLNLDPL